jgi:hypothetical protein
MRERKLLSDGNTKLGKIANFNLPTSVCNQKYVALQGCDKYCYARRLEKLRPALRAKLEWNLEQSRKETFVEDMCKELPFFGDVIRIHSFGDYYSQEYLDKWLEIAKRFPNKTFYSYTKNLDLNFSKRPANFKVILSDDNLIWGEPLYGLFDGVSTIESNAGLPTDKQQWFRCVGHCESCSYCWTASEPLLVFKLKR